MFFKVVGFKVWVQKKSPAVAIGGPQQREKKLR